MNQKSNIIESIQEKSGVKSTESGRKRREGMGARWLTSRRNQ
jgi:hypothetical protein